MTFAGINYLAIVVAAVASWLLGAAWYSALGKHWMAALGKTKADLVPSPRPFVIAFVAQLVMAWMLAGVIGHMGQVTTPNGLVSGAFVWLGFVITVLAVNHGFQGHKLDLTAIDGGHWLAVLLVQGAIIGAFGT